MLNFFSQSSKSKASCSSSSNASSSCPVSAAPPLQKKQKTAATVTVTTTTTTARKLVPKPPIQDPIASISGYTPINALPQEKRRRIIQDRLAAQNEKRTLGPSKNEKSKRTASTASDKHSSKLSGARRRTVMSSSDDDDDDDDDDDKVNLDSNRLKSKSTNSNNTSKRTSRAPSTPRGSKRPSVETVSDSYQRRAREGVTPHYCVPRDILARPTTQDQPRPIQSADVIATTIKSYGPFFHGLGDLPRATLEYPAKNGSEDFLLLVPKDPDEYDPVMELLSTVGTIVSNYLTPEQLKIFGSLDSLEISTNAGMILADTSSSAANPTSAQAKLNRSISKRAQSIDHLIQQESGVDAVETIHASQPESPRPQRHSHTAPVSPSTRGRFDTVPPLKLSTLKDAQLPSRSESPISIHSPLPFNSQSSTATTTTTTDPDSILRSFTKARNRRDGPLFLRTLARFNAELLKLKEAGAIEENIRQMGKQKGVPEGVWRLIQDQVYARTVGPRVDELGRYEAFSDNVYGELLPRFMSEVSQLTQLGPGKVFIDLGSGIGNLVIQTSLQTGCESYGCEIMPIPASLAEKQVSEAQKRWRLWSLLGGPLLETWKGDFGELEKVRNILRKADVILVNNYAFLPKTNENLSLLFLDLKQGSQIVSLKPFVPLDFRLTERTLSSPLAILKVQERQYTKGCVSWADGGGKYYIQTVDRSSVVDFYQNSM